ncbi:hypothetical protein [Amycolatopsis sp. NPDC059657]|uniref:hypothetical protein n=1 Tax=Amycolatopsis sp. NPDC059657 TaxID=3346899 RepID=UPI00366D238D
MTGGTVGIFTATDFQVTLTGSDVSIAPGRAAIPSPATESGVYLVEANAATLLTLDPADATRDRVDRLVAYPVPPATAADTGKWLFEIRKGTPSATPQPPSTSNTYFVWEFTVPAASKGTNPSGFDKRLTGGQQVISGPTISGLERPAVGRLGQLWIDAATAQIWVFTGTAWVRVSDPTLPRGVIAEVKRSTTDIVNGEVILERITASLSVGRKYKITWSTNVFADGLGPPNGTANIRLATGSSVTTTSPSIKSADILKENTTAQVFEVMSTFTVGANGAYSLGTSPTANGNPSMTFPGGGGRVFLLEDIGAA